MLKYRTENIFFAWKNFLACIFMLVLCFLCFYTYHENALFDSPCYHGQPDDFSTFSFFVWFWWWWWWWISIACWWWWWDDSPLCAADDNLPPWAEGKDNDEFLLCTAAADDDDDSLCYSLDSSIAPSDIFYWLLLVMMIMIFKCFAWFFCWCWE